MMKPEKQLFIKIGMVLFLAVYLGLLYTSDHAANVPMESIAASMESDSAITALEKRGRSDLKRDYQIDDSSTDGYFFYKAVSPMAVEEILIVKAHSKKQAQDFLEYAQAHLSSQKQIFEGYGTDQMALLNDAAAETKGSYMYYFCGSDAAKWRKKFLSLI